MTIRELFEHGRGAAWAGKDLTANIARGEKDRAAWRRGFEAGMVEKSAAGSDDPQTVDISGGPSGPVVIRGRKDAFVQAHRRSFKDHLNLSRTEEKPERPLPATVQARVP